MFGELSGIDFNLSTIRWLGFYKVEFSKDLTIFCDGRCSVFCPFSRR